jgi:hypothetical protein
MTALTGQSPKVTYKDLLQVSNSNSGIDSTLRTIEDGEGTSSAVKISTSALQVDNLKLTGNSITSEDTNGDLNVTPNGSGDLVLDGLKWPQADGTANQLLKTDGSGQLSWVSGATAVTLEVDGVQKSSQVATLDFDGTDFTVTESPTDDFDISIKAERIEDIAGAMVTGNTETGIAVTYQDGDGTLDFVVSDTTVAGDSGSTGITPGDTLTIAGSSPISTAMSGDTLTISSSALENVVEDTTPQLGGALDVNSQEITGAIDLHSTGDIINELGDAAGTNKVIIKDSGAVEVAAIDSDGNITTSGTVDGRDVATDGTKLDGIEASADVTDEANVTAALDGATISTATVAGTDKVLIQDVDDSDNLKTVTAQAIADLSTSGIANVVEDTTPQLGGDLDTNSNNIQFDDDHGILDDSGNEHIKFQKVSSAVNYLDVTNGPTTVAPKITWGS